MKIRGGKFLIAGGASLVGSHLAEQLLEGGAKQVVIFDNYSLGSPETVGFLADDKRVKIVRGDLLRFNEVLDATAGIDGVFLVAAFLTLPLSQNPWMGLDVNIRGTQNLLDACGRNGVKRFIFSSSSTVYGNAIDGEVTEDHPFIQKGLSPAPTIYGASKIIGEQLCSMYSAKYGFEWIALRYSSIYGERQHRRGLNALYIVQAHDRIRAGQQPIIRGDGSEVHDYLYAGDVARANILAMSSKLNAERFNIMTGVETSLNEVCAILGRVCRKRVKPEYLKTPGDLSFTSSTSLRYSRAKAEKMLGWVPQVSIEEGIRRLVAWRDANDPAPKGVKGARASKAKAKR